MTDGRGARASGWAYGAAITLSLLSFAAIALSLVLRVGFDVRPVDDFSGAANVVSGIAWPLLALLVLRQQPGNRLVWLFLVVGLSLALFLGGTDLATLLAARGLPGAPVADWIGIGFGEIGWPLLWVIAQVFPTGRPLPAAGWRWAFRLSIVWYVLGFAQVLFSEASRGTVWRSGNPLRVGWLEDAIAFLVSPFSRAQDVIGSTPASSPWSGSASPRWWSATAPAAGSSGPSCGSS